MKLMRIVLAVVIAIVAAAWLWLRGPDIPYATLEARYGAPDSRYVDLPGGYHVHYADDGDPNLPLLVLLHGFADSFTTWEGWVGELKTRYHIISVDFPGHGLTRAPEGSRLSGEGLADFVDAFAPHFRCRGSRWRAIPWAAARPGSWRCAIPIGSLR